MFAGGADACKVGKSFCSECSRIMTETARQRLAGFPVLSITGPRQSGKTTLSRLLAPDLPSLVSKLDETTQETTQEKIITLLLANPATTRVALAKALGITADGVKYHLDKLRAAGKIRHHGSTKAGHWEVTPE